MFQLSSLKFFLLAFLFLTPTALLTTQCGGTDTASTDEDEDADDDADNDDDEDDDAEASEDCSDGVANELVVGTYEFNLDDGDVQLRIFRDDCQYCSETLEEDEEDAAIDGEWTAELDDDGVTVLVTAGGITYELSSDGQTLEAEAFDLTFSKDISPEHSCDGEFVE